jgi:hypothetical protein
VSTASSFICFIRHPNVNHNVNLNVINKAVLLSKRYPKHKG